MKMDAYGSTMTLSSAYSDTPSANPESSKPGEEKALASPNLQRRAVTSSFEGETTLDVRRRLGTEARKKRLRQNLTGLGVVFTPVALGVIYLLFLAMPQFQAETRFNVQASQMSNSYGSSNSASPMTSLFSTGGGLGALAFVAFKVGALSYGGGFVIVPLMQHDAVSTYHWMTGPQFLDAVALGQITPGPVVLTVAVVGYAAAGIGGGLLAVLVAFAPSFVFVLAGGPRFDQIRSNVTIQAFLTGAGPAVIGAIAGSTIPLGLALQAAWQIPVLAGALIWLLVFRRGVVSTLVLAAAAGLVVALAGVPV